MTPYTCTICLGFWTLGIRVSSLGKKFLCPFLGQKPRIQGYYVCLDLGSANYGLLPVCINSYIGTQPWPFVCPSYGCFRNAVAKLSSCDRDYVALKVKNIYYLAFQENLCLDMYILAVIAKAKEAWAEYDLRIFTWPSEVWLQGSGKVFW